MGQDHFVALVFLCFGLVSPLFINCLFLNLQVFSLLPFQFVCPSHCRKWGSVCVGLSCLLVLTKTSPFSWSCIPWQCAGTLVWLVQPRAFGDSCSAVDFLAAMGDMAHFMRFDSPHFSTTVSSSPTKNFYCHFCKGDLSNRYSCSLKQDLRS